MNNLLFISGTSRSGTTLIDRLISSHPELSVLSQPFPYLFLFAKKSFLASLGYENEYNVLSSCFMEKRYNIRDFNNYLNNLTISSDEVVKLFEQMQNYSGQKIKLSNISILENLNKKDSFINHFKNLLSIMQKKTNISYVGSKEICCEEFFPFLTENSVKCIMIIRDPRDVISSSVFGNSEEYIGKHRPVLFYIRNWRKSVAFKIHLENNNNFLFLKYEDLVNNPLNELNKITEFLKIKNFTEEILRKDIVDQDGRRWVGNSSYNPDYSLISQKSQGKYKELMPPEMINYIESLCFPEMNHLNYEITTDTKDYKKHLLRYKEPFVISRPEFEPDFSTSESNLKDEIKRIELLQSQKAENANELTDYYIFSEVYTKLKKEYNIKSELRI